MIEQARKAAAATSYSIESLGTISNTYGTVATSVTANDSLEWTLQTPK